ncbi:MAG: Smr/MutS family protein [Firmicutes bacterium]|nr:Smr/MutS family protein [Bacillota bacterium]
MGKKPENRETRGGGAGATGTDRGRRLSREEADLWQRVTAGIEPLSGRKGKTAASEPEENGRTAGRKKPIRRSAAGAPALAPPSFKLPEIGHGETAGIDKRTAQRMRRGQLPIEGRIDLHGLTQEEAHRALSSFLAGSQNAGRRCVLVVTGKGLRPDGQTGVLRQNVPRWLNAPSNRGRVLAFSYAQIKDGGEGALYVLLRRKK